MDRRVEPRLKTETDASLTVLRHSRVLEIKCLIVEASGVGYRLSAHESLDPEETIQLKLNGARVLARVQYCQPDGEKFLIGLERVDEWLVAPAVAAQRSFPSNAGAPEPLRTLGRPKVNYFDRLSRIAARLLFARSIVHEDPHSRKIAKMALAIAAASAIVLLGFYSHLFSTRLRGNSAPRASAAAKSADTPQGVIAGKPAAPQASQEPHQVLVIANDNGWVLACSDGRKVFEKLLKSGDVERFRFSKEALLHSGNAGALEIAIDSLSLGVMGGNATARTWRFSPDGYKDVPVAANQTCEIR